MATEPSDRAGERSRAAAGLGDRILASFTAFPPRNGLTERLRVRLRL